MKIIQLLVLCCLLSNTLAAQEKEMAPDSFEEFIFEHYYGYTKIDSHTTEEYRVNHPRWQTNEVLEYCIDCDFEKMYGPAFKYLATEKPATVFAAEGSAVSVNWKRKRLTSF